MSAELEDCIDDLTNAMQLLRQVARKVPDSVRLKSTHDRLTRDVAVLVLVLDEASRGYSDENAR